MSYNGLILKHWLINTILKYRLWFGFIRGGKILYCSPDVDEYECPYGSIENDVSGGGEENKMMCPVLELEFYS